MQRTTIRLASRDYDGMAPIIRGDVTIPGYELAVNVDNSVPRVFAALYRGTVDVSEMSLAELIYYVSRDEAEFIAIPVFPSRVFRHGHLFCTQGAGIAGPGDLNGRRIGFQRWVQTAAVWMRGMLVEDYGVSPTDTQWHVAATHHWDDDHGEAIVPRDGSVIRRYTTSSVTGADTAYQALLAGEVDAMGVTEVQAPALLADAKARRLFADWRAEETAYYQRTHIFPIMHVLAMRRSLVDAHPELPEALFTAFSQAKRQAHERMHALPSWSLAWKDDYIRDERAIFGGDLWPFGLAANQHVLDTFIGYCYQQGIAARPLAARELFVPSTCDLTES
jgi:4,5-dihydroxyphthalate decarboxylase